MAFDTCAPLINKQVCLIHRKIPPLPAGAMAAARRTGMAKTAQELVKLRRALAYYKKEPCIACIDSDGKAIPNLAVIAKHIADTASQEHVALLHAAMSQTSHLEPYGFVLSSPVKDQDPVAMKFTIPNTWTFLKMRLGDMFGRKSLAVTCSTISWCIDKALVDVKAALVEVDPSAKPSQR